MKILLSKNKEVIKKYLKENMTIGFIPTASEPDKNRWYMEEDRADLSKMNLKVIDIDISNETREEIIKKFNNVDVIFVAGGNSFYLLQQLKIKNIVQDLIEFANNKMYIGSSAGSCILCPSIDYVQKLDDKSQAPLLNNYAALNLVNFYIIPHYKSKEKYTKIANEIEKDYPNYNFVKLSNEEAIIIDDMNNCKITKTN